MARDRGAPQIALQVLIYPSVELIDTFPSEDENEFAPILGKADLTAFSALYRGTADGTDPYGSPLRGKHHDLPPALIQTAQHDPLRDHGTAYAAALRSAGRRGAPDQLRRRGARLYLAPRRRPGRPAGAG